MNGPGMTVDFCLRPDEIEIHLNAGIGIVSGISKEQTRRLLLDLGGYVSETTQEYLLDEAKEQGLV